MSSDISSKLNRLLSSQPSGAGALIRYGDRVDYLGGVYAMQAHLGLSLHLGGKTAPGLQGKAHYLELSPKQVELFGVHGERTI